MYQSIQRYRDYQKKYYRKPQNKWIYFVRQLFRYYKLTEVEYLQLLWKTKGRCFNSSCNSPGLDGERKGLAVDHDHATGKVRGLLCPRCNAFLAYLETVKNEKELMNGLQLYLIING